MPYRTVPGVNLVGFYLCYKAAPFSLPASHLFVTLTKDCCTTCAVLFGP